MIQIFTLIGQLLSNPQTAQLVRASGLAVRRTIDRLSPETKAKLEGVIRWGVKRAAHHALKTVLGDVAGQVFGLVPDRDVAEFAQKVVERGVVVGVDKALREANVT